MVRGMLNTQTMALVMAFLGLACSQSATGKGDCVTIVGTGGAGGEGGSEGGIDTATGSQVACPFESECDPSLADPPFAPKQCDDADDSTADRCADAAPCGGVCAHVPAQCDHFDGAPKQQVTCDDANPCTADICGPLNACAHEILPNGTACVGTSAGTCDDGECI